MTRPYPATAMLARKDPQEVGRVDLVDSAAARQAT
jgi:hypothetical protein